MSEPDELSVFQLCSLYIEVWDVNTLIVSEAVYSHAIVITPPSYRRVFPTISPAKMNGSKPKLAGRNYVTKGTHKKIWGPVPCVAPPRLFFVCLCVASPFGPLGTENRPWDNRGKCHMGEKRIQCLSKASHHVPIYLQPFPSNSSPMFKSSPF